MAPQSGGTFQPLRHRSGTMRERLHAYTKRTLGAGGSYNDAVSYTSMNMNMNMDTDMDMDMDTNITYDGNT